MRNIILTESQFNTILEEVLLMEATLEDIYAKYYSDIPQDIFYKLIQVDPTARGNHMGKYGKWLLDKYRTNGINLDDTYLNLVKECLISYNTFINVIDQKDIMKIKSTEDLYRIVQPYIENPDQATSKGDAERRAKQGAEKVYEDGEWLIVVPKTEEAAKWYGKGTKWCTAANNDNRFDYYNEQGSLYININKQNPSDKYQFHFESEQFMNAEDEPIDPLNIDLSDGVINFYREKYPECVEIMDEDDMDFDELAEYRLKRLNRDSDLYDIFDNWNDLPIYDCNSSFIVRLKGLYNIVAANKYGEMEYVFPEWVEDITETEWYEEEVPTVEVTWQGGRKSLEYIFFNKNANQWGEWDSSTVISGYRDLDMDTVMVKDGYDSSVIVAECNRGYIYYTMNGIEMSEMLAERVDDDEFNEEINGYLCQTISDGETCYIVFDFDRESCDYISIENNDDDEEYYE